MIQFLLVISLQAIKYWFIFFLMGVEQELASKWNTIQEVSKTSLNIIKIDTEFGSYILTSTSWLTQISLMHLFKGFPFLIWTGTMKQKVLHCCFMHCKWLYMYIEKEKQINHKCKYILTFVLVNTDQTLDSLVDTTFLSIPSLCMGFTFRRDANTSKYFYNYYMNMNQPLLSLWKI